MTWRQIAADAGETVDPDDPWYDQGGLQACVEGCPYMNRVIEHAREVAHENGWTRPDGSFVWEQDRG